MYSLDVNNKKKCRKKNGENETVKYRETEREKERQAERETDF